MHRIDLCPTEVTFGDTIDNATHDAPYIIGWHTLHTFTYNSLRKSQNFEFKGGEKTQKSKIFKNPYKNTNEIQLQPN